MYFYSHINEAGSGIEEDADQNIEEGDIQIDGDMATCSFKRPTTGNDDDDVAGTKDKPTNVLAPTDACTRTGDKIDTPTNVEASSDKVCPVCSGKCVFAFLISKKTFSLN